MVDFAKFSDWAERRFADTVVSGNEIQVNSIFDPNKDDTKHKLWCNPSGGKNEYNNGVYHCWISGKKGSLVGLVMEVDKCSYEEACEVLGLDDFIGDTWELLNDFFASKKPDPIIEKPVPKLTLPPEFHKISSLSNNNWFRHVAETYLEKRRMPIDGLYVCTDKTSKYRNRVIIPYYDKDGMLIYYNCRTFGEHYPRYLGPPKEIGVGKGDVVFMPKWAPDGSTVCVTEGEFDAIALNLCGFYSVAIGGSNLTETQKKILLNYKVILCGDSDGGAGENSLIRTGRFLTEMGVKDIQYVFPPKPHKDWNELYVKIGNLTKNYIEIKKEVFDEIKVTQILMSLLD